MKKIKGIKGKFKSTVWRLGGGNI